MIHRIIIIANGIVYPEICNDVVKTDYIIGVDRAAYWLIQHRIVPNVAVGDFDSTSSDEMAQLVKRNIEIKRFPPEKDFTDSELAVRHAISLSPKSIVIYGGSGTRLDHELGVIHLLEICQLAGIQAVFRNQTNEIAVIGRGRTILNKRRGSRYVSIVPITQTIQVSLSGFKYNLSKKIIHRGQTIGISNEFIRNQADIMIHRGKSFVIQSSD